MRGAPEALALDAQLGIVVLAGSGNTQELLAERPPAGSPVTIAP
jgi:hypothetical protein